MQLTVATFFKRLLKMHLFTLAFNHACFNPLFAICSALLICLEKMAKPYHSNNNHHD